MPKLIKNWIFTISYAGLSGLFDKYLCRRDAYGLDTAPFSDYVEVLVVQSGTQFNLYQRNLANDFIIISLPSEISFKNESYFANKHGCGHARLFTQIFAAAIGPDAIWCLDDNIKRCYEVDIQSQTTQDCSFMKVMTSIETIFNGDDCNSDESMHYDLGSFEPAPFTMIRGPDAGVNVKSADCLSELQAVTPFRKFFKAMKIWFISNKSH